MVSSEPEARWLVSFFSLVILTSRSPSLFLSPIIIPSYTSVPGGTNKTPLSTIARLAYGVTFPFLSEINTPLVLCGISPDQGA